MDYIEIGEMQGYSHDRIEKTIIKEFLIEKKTDMQREIDDIENKFLAAGISSHIFNIIRSKLEERISVIDYYLNNMILEINNIDNEHINPKR